ncbi:MAG: cation-translocating P-type ATPase, partial [Clostridia bacterium]|nr:cation-translocating P-type ATPase [Clostridia bacterium]
MKENQSCNGHHAHNHAGDKECCCAHHHEHECNHGDNHCHHHSHKEHQCYHNDGCGCGHEHAEISKSDIVLCGVSVILFIASALIKSNVMSAIICVTSVIFSGYKIFAMGIKALLKFKFDENTLIVIAVLASVILGEFNEAYFITLLFSIGNFLENYAVGKSRGRIESLIDLTSDSAYNELGEKIEPQSLKAGDRFLVKPGDKVCLDGKVISGSSSFDTSNITGESIPVDLGPEDKVISGYVNLSASVVCIATADYANSTASKIKEYVMNASSKKAGTERFITKFASIYTPAVIIAALILGIVLAISGLTEISEAIKRALTFMIASCPCALVISIPLSYYASIGAIGKYGILIKGSKYINVMSKADTIAFDKTGTITKGKLCVSEIVCTSETSKDTVLMLAKALERHSSHPIAEAICSSYTGDVPEATDVKEHFGKGMEGRIDGHRIILGTSDFCMETGCMQDNGISARN